MDATPVLEVKSLQTYFFTDDGAVKAVFEGDDDAVWTTLRAAHEAMLAAGASTGLSHVKIASVGRTMESLTHKFR